VDLNGAGDIHALACDTDGIDGSEDNAGAVLAPDSLQRAQRKGLDAPKLLDDNDGYGFFSALGDLVVTGPTRTNVNDYRVILVT
jgi:hydroxypyruvate reductase